MRSLRPLRLIRHLAALALLTACRLSTPSPSVVPAPVAQSRQLVVVTTPTWSTTSASLWRFTRASDGAAWQLVSGPTPAVVGRTGLAWGVEYENAADITGGSQAPHKHEGDGKSPAGAFPLDTVFGFEPAQSASWVRMPYAQLTSTSDCVDDEQSEHYNTVVRRDGVTRLDWSSAEHMRSIWQYEMGVIVGYNAAPPRRGRGSCIFLHIWDGPSSHTAGCTAFDKEELRRVIAWLDPRQHPALVQLPADEYERLRSRWQLPVIR